jgi:hypothetical protein
MLLSLSAIFITSSEKADSIKAEKTALEVKDLIKKSGIGHTKDANSTTSIIFLGSSLTRHALYNFEETEKLFTLNPKSKTTILKLAINGLSYEELKESKTLEYIIESPPDYLFIESNHINIENKSHDGKFKLLSFYLNNLVLIARKIFNGLEDEFKKIFEATPEDPFFTGNFNKDHFAQILLIKRDVRKFSQNKEVNESYAELIKRKTKIIFLDMPRSSKLDCVWLNSTQKKELQTLLQAYKQSYNIEYWKYPYSLKDSDFIDGGHLNSKGAKKYQKWLATQFKLFR